jgi:hypothetical protein
MATVTMLRYRLLLSSEDVLNGLAGYDDALVRGVFATARIEF